jgi:hypothetical protein
MAKKGKLGVLGGCIGFSILFSVLTLLWSESHTSSSIEWFGDDWGEAGDYVGKAMFDRDAYVVTGGPINEFIDHYVWKRLHPNDGFTKKRFVLIIWLLVCVSTGTIVGLVLITVRRPAFFQRKLRFYAPVAVALGTVAIAGIQGLEGFVLGLGLGPLFMVTGWACLGFRTVKDIRDEWSGSTLESQDDDESVSAGKSLLKSGVLLLALAHILVFAFILSLSIGSPWLDDWSP